MKEELDRIPKEETKPSPLSDEQKEKYLKNPTSCPFCGSPEIESEEIEADGKTATAAVNCNNCDSAWDDIYTLTGIDGV